MFPSYLLVVVHGGSFHGASMRPLGQRPSLVGWKPHFSLSSQEVRMLIFHFAATCKWLPSGCK